VVFARDGSEAGGYYNESSKKILLDTICSVTKQEHFQLENNLMDCLKVQMPKYIYNPKTTALSFKFVTIPKQPALTMKEENQINDELGSENQESKREFLKLTSDPPHSISFKPCDYDEFGLIKQHSGLTNQHIMPYQFYDAGNSYVLQVEMPGFIQEDLDSKKVQVRCKKEQQGLLFSCMIEAKEKVRCPEQSIMDSTMQYGDVICQISKIQSAKNEVFGDKVSQVLRDGLLTMTWSKKKPTDLDEI